jgi:hypothetical protein
MIPFARDYENHIVAGMLPNADDQPISDADPVGGH